MAELDRTITEELFTEVLESLHPVLLYILNKPLSIVKTI